MHLNIRARWIIAEGGSAWDWAWSFVFGWICILSGLLFRWIQTHDPVWEGGFDPIWVALHWGPIGIGLLLFSASIRDWRAARVKNLTRDADLALLKAGQFCPRCRIAWDGDSVVDIPS